MTNEHCSDAFIDKYLPDFEGMDMSLEQKRECIKALKSIAQTFVDQAWDQHR